MQTFDKEYKFDNSDSEPVNETDSTPYKMVKMRNSMAIKEKLRQLAFEQWEMEKKEHDNKYNWEYHDSTYQ